MAIWLIAAGPTTAEAATTAAGGRRWLAGDAGAGVGFGVYFVALKMAGTTAGVIWPMATARMGSLSCAR
jgi:ribose 5-phosphate isomerase RpiB